MQVKSSSVVVKDYVTSLWALQEELSHIPEVVRDTRTTVAGNARADEAIRLAQTTSIQIGEAVSQAATQLMDAASRFDAVDSNAARSLSELAELW